MARTFMIYMIDRQNVLVSLPAPSACPFTIREDICYGEFKGVSLLVVRS